jgi:hypothetical protein
MSARQSRLYFRTSTPTSLGEIITHAEGDFYGAGGSETNTNSAAFRIRHAYIEMGSWLAGQTWWNHADLASLPETLDFSGGLGGPQAGRQPQLRYTYRWGGGGPGTFAHQLSGAIENPESDIFGTVQTGIAAGAGPTSLTTIDKTPDFSLRYVFATDWGRMSFAGLYRHLTLNNRGGAAINGFVGESSDDAWVWTFQGRIKTFGDDSFTYGATGGPGAGRYILSVPNNIAAVIDNGELKAIRSEGYTLSYQHFWSNAWRSNVLYGYIKQHNPHPAVPTTAISKQQGWWVNLIWSPVPNALVGVEYNWNQVKNDTDGSGAVSNKGRNNRLEFSFQYGF